jgi:hypothetical protein
MPDYQKLYALLCCAASEALDVLPHTPENTPARLWLQVALLWAEELYIRGFPDVPEHMET